MNNWSYEIIGSVPANRNKTGNESGIFQQVALAFKIPMFIKLVSRYTTRNSIS